jgi:uncharacterized protein (DUF2164 family)
MAGIIKGIRTATKTTRKKVKKAAEDAEKLERSAPKPKRGTEKSGKKVEFEGARANAETRGSDRVARDVEGGKAGEVNRGREPGFLESQRTPSSRAVAKQKAELQRKVDDGTATKAEKAELKALRLKDQLDLSRAQQAAGQTRKSTPKAERTDYIDPETGEIFGKPTKNQLEAAARNARARGMSKQEREYKAFLEKEYGVKFYAGGIADSRYVNLVTTVDRRKKK